MGKFYWILKFTYQLWKFYDFLLCILNLENREHSKFQFSCCNTKTTSNEMHRFVVPFAWWLCDTDNNPIPGRQRTSTDERSVKLVADVLEEDRRATCEELSRATRVKTSQENAQEPTSVAPGRAPHSPWQFLPAHCGCCNQKLSDYGWEVFSIAPYSSAIFFRRNGSGCTRWHASQQRKKL